MIFSNERTRTVTEGQRNRLSRQAKGRCEHCKKEIIGQGIKPNVHHIKPFAKGGSDRDSNLIVLCPDCHSKVDLIQPDELKRNIAYRVKTRGETTSIEKKVEASTKTVEKAGTKKPRTSPTSAVSYLRDRHLKAKVYTTILGFAFSGAGATGAFGGGWPEPCSVGRCNACGSPLPAWWASPRPPL